MLDAVVISDLHLGSENLQVKFISKFLHKIINKDIKTERLVLNGDVFDSHDFGRLKGSHWEVVSLLRRISKKVEVDWICGNHDLSADILSCLLGFHVYDELIIESGRKRILAIHGHQWDEFIKKHPILTGMGDAVYNLLQRLDRSHKLARGAKHSSKTFLRCSDKIKAGAARHAKSKNCDAVVCGHTHHAIADLESVVPYFNSGCWTERPCSYLTIRDGEVSIKYVE